MRRIQRFSEQYRPTGSLAAEGALNPLGRPDIEALEVLLREAIQNCWDARRPSELGIRVEIGRRRIVESRDLRAVRDEILLDPPPGLPLDAELGGHGLQTLYFADFGTSGLGGPTRADRAGPRRDFVDFIRNIGEPPDRDLGGGSFGYGKAAFYLASRARTVVVDTLCTAPDGSLERRFIGCALGESFEDDERLYTGRHWWGQLVDGVPEPLVGWDAEYAAQVMGLPEREGHGGLGTTVAVVAPELLPETDDGTDPTMDFIAEALAWNFWPRMIDTPGGARRSMTFYVTDDRQRIRLPSPRTHPRLRGFVEAMDRLREEPQGDSEFVLDRQLECLRPIRALGRLVVQKGPVAPVILPSGPVPQGALQMVDSVNHVALMRNVELVVKYLPGPAATTGRTGYSGVFCCAVDLDAVFRRTEPPTHDDWIYRALPPGHDRTFVKVALDRIADVCREAAGYEISLPPPASGDAIPLGEFADELAVLIPGLDGPGARRRTARVQRVTPRGNAVQPRFPESAGGEVWVDGETSSGPVDNAEDGVREGRGGDNSAPPRPALPPPQVRSGGAPQPAVASDGTAVIRYPFELRANDNRLRLRAAVEVMTSDGGQVEAEAPVGYTPPSIRAWSDPSGVEHLGAALEIGPADADGMWFVQVPIVTEAVMRVDIVAEVV